MINFKKHSGIYTLETQQELNISIEKAWDYFSSPENLAKITPPKMGFNITSQVDKKAYQGQIITYKVSPVPFIKTNWVTEITQVKEQDFFIDEQRFGPYKMWHHEHWFEKLTNGNTLMKDKISYKIPFGFLGHLAQSIFIKKQLNTIFNYRFITLEKLFNDK
ncbi:MULTISPECIES: SRPBCC family protein [Tenacibaculum]|uniref:SRPBCC family protein n=1 Tax=Tenacibaculum TaxID=104267 RepID=UPI001F0AEFFE|nr:MULTISPECIES: SRPBCC family protein [Tenacibaculum]MCH3881025.1 SRPBCC family protein [Tenacibaculum aquimarinum]MCH3884105.1 SRPBCC family protein [Tenacibaculum aquimarinum]MDO6599375.1 SRPBCC family protein [Tenacibaculum sp. 1_MG-2023]